MTSNPPSALSGLTIIEHGRGIAAPFCAKLLADMGAEVIKIEAPPQGDEARSRGAFPDDHAHPERSAVFLYANTNKLGITLNLRDPAGYGILQGLLQQADIFVHDRSARESEDLRISHTTLQRLNPRLIVTTVTPFGHSGPHAEHRAYGLNVCHAGGEGYVLPGGAGHRLFPDRPPVQLGGHAVEYDAGISAAVGTVFAVVARETWGCGQHVDVSAQEAAMALNRVSFVTLFSEGKVVRRANRFYAFGGLYPASNGEVVLRPTENNHWRALAHVIGRPELADDPRFKDRGSRAANGAAMNALVSEWTRRHTKQEIMEVCHRSGCPVGPAYDARQIMESPQLAQRGFFQEIAHPEAGAWRYPTAPYQFSETPWRCARPAPMLGQHTQQVLEGRLGLSALELAVLRANGVV